MPETKVGEVKSPTKTEKKRVSLKRKPVSESTEEESISFGLSLSTIREQQYSYCPSDNE